MSIFSSVRSCFHPIIVVVTVVTSIILFSLSVFYKKPPYLQCMIAQTSIELSPGFDATKREYRISIDITRAVIVLELFTTDCIQRKTLPTISSMYFAGFLGCLEFQLSCSWQKVRQLGNQLFKKMKLNVLKSKLKT